MKIKKGDNVIVKTGKDKGTKGKVLSVNKLTNRIVVSGVAKVKKHLKPQTKNEKGSIVEVEGSIHSSNVMILDSKGKATRISKKLVAGKMVRIAKSTGQELA